MVTCDYQFPPIGCPMLIKDSTLDSVGREGILDLMKQPDFTQLPSVSVIPLYSYGFGHFALTFDGSIRSVTSTSLFRRLCWAAFDQYEQALYSIEPSALDVNSDYPL
ncbi:unnamed protein product [Anisakis simplex]|uniref:COesterase domain-containing protein n=1 Tax=Anisakis simplex TaxID=6269 RepID=A0A0M3KJ74_ANISI|nr:unnamed protein product [Anisakis simplex]